MQFGKVWLSLPEMAGLTEKEFYGIVRGHLDIDKKEAWEKWKKEAQKHKKTKELPEVKDPESLV